jgi:hypothetical protein
MASAKKVSAPKLPDFSARATGSPPERPKHQGTPGAISAPTSSRVTRDCARGLAAGDHEAPCALVAGGDGQLRQRFLDQRPGAGGT